MKTLYATIKSYLETEPKARERRNRERALINLLLEKYQFFKDIPKQTLIDFCHDFASYDRIWRKVVSENPTLQGSDYKDKNGLEQEKMLSLGYEAGYHQDIKKLKTLL